jgi:hypothetical protein
LFRVDDNVGCSDEGVVAVSEQITCSSTLLPLSEFNRATDGSFGGRRAACKKCQRQYAASIVWHKALGTTNISAAAVQVAVAAYSYKPNVNNRKENLAANNTIDENGVAIKVCTGPCKRALVLNSDNLCVDRGGVGGFASQCYRCHSFGGRNLMDISAYKGTPNRRRAAIAARDSVNVDGEKWRTCTGPCNATKMLNSINFPSRSKNQGGAFMPRCKVCTAVYHAAYRQKRKLSQ